LYNASTKFKFHDPKFNNSEVIVLTNKQTHKQVNTAENIQFATLCYTGGEQVDLIEECHRIYFKQIVYSSHQFLK